jgi:hypothetical protein
MDSMPPARAGTTKGALMGGHAVWQYTGDTWVLKKDACEPGYVCGDPPREPGQYEGEVRRTRCVRKEE